MLLIGVAVNFSHSKYEANEKMESVTYVVNLIGFVDRDVTVKVQDIPNTALSMF